MKHLILLLLTALCMYGFANQVSAANIIPVSVATKSQFQQAGGPTLTWSHTSSGTNPVLVVYLSYRSAGSSDATYVKSVTFGPQKNTLKKVRRDRGHEYVSEVWYLINPYPGTSAITVTFAGTPDSIVTGGVTFANVDQTAPLAVSTGVGTASSTFVKTISLSPTAVTNGMIFGVATVYSGYFNVVSTGTGMTSLSNRTLTNVVGSAVTSLAGPLTWKSTSAWPWAASAITLKPAPAPEILTKKVLVIGYNPSEKGKTVADTYYKTAMGGLSADAFEDKVVSRNIANFQSLSHGEIQYSVAGKINIRSFQPYPNGYTFTLASYKQCVWGTPGFNPTFCESLKKTFDYKKWITDNHICEQAASLGATEIWAINLPYVQSYENYMVGPTAGYFVNGPSFVLPACKIHMNVINPTYDRGDLGFHNIGHLIESTMSYLTGKWTAADKEKYWERFAQIKLYAGTAVTTPYCGNAHYTTNSQKAYDMSNSKTVETNCPDFGNFPNYNGVKATVSCSAWGCTDEGWQRYWFGSIPRQTGTVTLTTASGKKFNFPKNWWKYILFPDAAISAYTQM